MIEYIPNHKLYSKNERGYCVLVCYEQKHPPGFKITFPFIHNPSLKLVTQNLQKRNMFFDRDFGGLPRGFLG
jgi:hypothetical protein